MPDNKIISKLHDVVEWSKRQLEKTAKERVTEIDQFVGAHYGREGRGSKKRMPMNLMELAVTIYVRLLAARAPKVNVSTKDRTLRPFAANMQIVLNQLPEELKLSETIREAVLEAIFSIGIVKVGISGTSEDPKIGDEPFVTLVQLDDYFCDMSARSWKEVQYEGNDYWLDTLEIKELYGVELAPDSYSGLSNNGVAQANHVSSAEERQELYPRVLVRDVYLNRENRLITYAVNTMTVLRDIPWDGPEGSPYVKLCFSKVPGNLMPLSPAALWTDLNELANTIFRKLAKQGEARKSIAVFSGGTDEDAMKFKAAKDGEGIRANVRPEQVAVGGIDQVNLAFLLQLRDMFSLLGGNLDSLGGLSPQADTAAQDKLISSAASTRIKDMADRTIEFAREIFKRLAWYAWTDPVRVRNFRKVANAKYDIGVDLQWTPKTRDGDFLDYNFTIAVHSMEDDSPEIRLNKLGTVFERFIAPLLQDMMAQGFGIDYDWLLNYLGENANLPEIVDFVHRVDAPMPQPGAAASLPQPSYVSTKAPVTRRVYERVNRPGSMSERGKTAVLTAALLGKGSQSADIAGLSMGRAS